MEGDREGGEAALLQFFSNFHLSIQLMARVSYGPDRIGSDGLEQGWHGMGAHVCFFHLIYLLTYLPIYLLS